jgi:hypothetical protein
VSGRETDRTQGSALRRRLDLPPEGCQQPVPTQAGIPPVAARGVGGAAGQEQQETIGAYGVQADEVAGTKVPGLAQLDEDRREVADRLVVGRPSELGFVPARAAQIEVDDVDGSARLDDAADVLDQGWQRGRAPAILRGPPDEFNRPQQL